MGQSRVLAHCDRRAVGEDGADAPLGVPAFSESVSQNQLFSCGTIKMRHRPVKNKDQIVEAGRQWLAEDPESLKGNWRSLFSFEEGPAAEDRPLFVEIGSGKGKFISEEALAHPGSCYLACEGGGKIYPRILQKIEELQLDNLRVIPSYYLKERPCFGENELDGIYLNFSDPWPKARNEKRRLTHRGFLQQYMEFVKPGGFLSFKTDNDDLFEWSLLEFEAMGLEPERLTRDLHSSPWAEEMAWTEYETKFSERGKSINYAYLILKKPEPSR